MSTEKRAESAEKANPQQEPKRVVIPAATAPQTAARPVTPPYHPPWMKKRTPMLRTFNVRGIGRRAASKGLDQPVTIVDVCDESEAIRRFILEKHIPEKEISSHHYRAEFVSEREAEKVGA